MAFDLANHWCEWAADYHSPCPHALDFERLMSEAQQRTFVEQYLRALLGAAGVSLDAAAAPGAATAVAAQQQGTPPAGSGACPHSLRAWLQPYMLPSSGAVGPEGWARLVGDLHAASLAYLCASHAQWALWGWIQMQASDVSFDFRAYAAQRWERYLLTRPAQMQRQ